MFALSLCCCLSAAPSHCMSTTINHTMRTIRGIAISYGCERKAQSLGDSTPMKMSKDFKWVFDSDFMTVYICSFMPLYREWREHVYVVLRSFVGPLVSDSEHNKLTCCSWIQSGHCCCDSDNSSEFMLIYFMISVYEVKLHNRAAGSADVSASSHPQVLLTPLEIENGKGLVHRRMVVQCPLHTNTLTHPSISHSWDIYSCAAWHEWNLNEILTYKHGTKHSSCLMRLERAQWRAHNGACWVRSCLQCNMGSMWMNGNS